MEILNARRSKEGDFICGTTEALRHADRQEINDTTIPTCVRNKEREELKEESEQATEISRVQRYIP